MAFPKKFKGLLETSPSDVDPPVDTWITYAVCGVDDDSCGWGGWILEGIRGTTGQLPANTQQICPECGKELLRTEVSVRFEPSEDQTPDLIAGVDYETVPIEYK